MTGWETWFSSAQSGDDRAISKILTLIERGVQCPPLFRKIYQQDSPIYSIAITGPAGVGKSSLIAHLAEPLTRNQYLGIIAIDPRSLLRGGAFLGDRIRLGTQASHPRIFFRSFAPRYAPFSGYLVAKTMARAFGAFGFGCALIETVGVGQSEWALPLLADTTILILSPESGDEIQMMKRGIIEWADIFVINKADRVGAKSLESALMQELHSRNQVTGWKPPILTTIASHGEGVDKLLEAIERHHQFLKISGRLDGIRQKKEALECMVWALSMTWDRLTRSVNFSKNGGANNPYEAAKRVLKEISRGRKK